MNTPDTSTTSGKIAVMAAFEQGKKIEAFEKYLSGTWTIAHTPSWNWHMFDYRIAPSSIAPGHNPDNLTEEQVETDKGWRLLAPEEIRDRKITFDIQLYDDGWRTYAASGSNEEYTYRTLRPAGYFLPKTRPLRKEDWDGLPVVWVRSRNEKSSEWMATGITTMGFLYAGLARSWSVSETGDKEWSTDRKTWRPFIIEE